MAFIRDKKEEVPGVFPGNNSRQPLCSGVTMLIPELHFISTYGKRPDAYQNLTKL